MSHWPRPQSAVPAVNAENHSMTSSNWTSGRDPAALVQGLFHPSLTDVPPCITPGCLWLKWHIRVMCLSRLKMIGWRSSVDTMLLLRTDTQFKEAHHCDACLPPHDCVVNVWQSSLNVLQLIFMCFNTASCLYPGYQASFLPTSLWLRHTSSTVTTLTFCCTYSTRWITSNGDKHLDKDDEEQVRVGATGA